MTVKLASEKWGISDRRIRVLCAEGKIPGAYQKGEVGKFPLMRVSQLMEDINQKRVFLNRLTVNGIGKSEPLKHRKACSRRITEEH